MGKAKTKGKGTKRPKNGKPDAAQTFDILTLDEAAALLRVTADGLRADAERGTVPARLIAGEWRFARPTLWEWAKSSTPNGHRRKLTDMPMPDLPLEEYEAYRARLAASRDEVDRLTKSGRYAEDE